MLRGSSLLFSGSFIQRGDFYLKNDFINKMYFYYFNRGLSNIILDEVVSIIISTFTVFLIIFMIKCIDYQGIIAITNDNTRKYLVDYIDINNYFNLHWMFWVLVVSFFSYIFFRILAIIDKVRIYKKVQHFYNNELNISDNEIKTISWQDIVSKIFNKYNHVNFDVYNVAGRITVEDNYLIALFDRHIIEIDCLTDLMQWNIKYCIIHSIFNEEQKIHNDFFQNWGKYVKSIQKRMFYVSIVNFIMMPFILVFILFVNFFTYCENLYSKPGALLNYNWTHLANWKLRYYNELYHNFHERLELAKKPSSDYMSQFPNKILDSLKQLLVFIISSLFSILVILSLVNEKILVNVNLFNKTIIWYITVLGSVAAILRSTISHKIVYYPREKMTEIKNTINCIPEEWLAKANTRSVKNKFSTYYEYKIKTILKNIVYTFLVPFHLWYMYFSVPIIVKFIKDKTVRHPNMGLVCVYSLFDEIEYQNSETDKKTLASYNNFKDLHENWEHNRYNV